jgi:hypothetical protein
MHCLLGQRARNCALTPRRLAAYCSFARVKKRLCGLDLQILHARLKNSFA